MSPPPGPSGRFLDFLDRAYDAPAQPERFEALMEAAKAYFFDDAEAALTPDSAHFAAFDARLAPHIARIQALLDGAGAARSIAAPESAAYGRFVLAAGGRVIAGNDAARAFLSAEFPCGIDALNLDYQSRKRLSGALAGDAEASAIIRLVNETGDGGGAIAFCQRAGEGGESRLEISLSHIAWTDEIIAQVGRALGLTEAEADVLYGLVEGQSQAEIAHARTRALDTVKSQAKSILRKSGCTRMSDVVQLAVSTAFLLGASGRAAPTRAAAARVETPLFLDVGGGRELGYYVHGAPRGAPVVYFHGSLQGPFFRQSFVDGLKALGVTLYGPSRPGFGATSPAGKGLSFDEATVNDVERLFDHEGLNDVLFLVQHGGVSHAYRAAARLGDRVKGLVMIGGGVPIDEKTHVPHMDRYTRIAAAAVKHAPAMMELISRIAISVYRRRGYRDFLKDYFACSPADLAALGEPELYSIMEKGLDHLIGQGPKTFVIDGASQMADWRADFERVNARTFWLHAEDDPILPVRFVRDWVTSRTNHPVETAPEGGYNFIHVRADLVLEKLRDALGW